MSVYEMVGPIRTVRPMSPVTHLVIIGIIIAGAVILTIYFGLPSISQITPETVTEEVTITTSAGGICLANTKDAATPSKTIADCDLPEGTKVTISYQKGLPLARIVSQG